MQATGELEAVFGQIGLLRASPQCPHGFANSAILNAFLSYFCLHFGRGREKLCLTSTANQIALIFHWLKSHTLTEYPEYWTHRWLLLRLFQNFRVAQGHLKAKGVNTSNSKDFNTLHWFSVSFVLPAEYGFPIFGLARSTLRQSFQQPAVDDHDDPEDIYVISRKLSFFVSNYMSV